MSEPKASEQMWRGFGRRVVTGHDAEGQPVFVSDGPPSRTIETDTGLAVSELFWWEGDRPRDAPFDLEPPPGGVSWRLIRFPKDEEYGMHTTDTLDFMVVLDGEIVLGLDDGEHQIGAGDAIIQRGTAHRWRVSGNGPCTYAVVMVRPVAGGGSSVTPRPGDGDGPRRVVTATEGGRSRVLFDGPPPVRFPPKPGGPVAIWDYWQTGGPVRHADQGGDPEGDWALEPVGGGVAFRLVEWEPGHDPGEAGWHTTHTIDLDLVLSGRLELALPGLDPVVLGPGDAVVQQATEHRWRPLGDEPVRMAAVMLGLP